MADYSEEESSGDESMEAAALVAGKKLRGTVVKTIECPGCGEAIELTKLRPIEVQCGDCDDWVSHDWPENHGKVQKEVKRLRELHFKKLAYDTKMAADPEGMKAKQKAARDAKPELTPDELEAARAKGRETMAQRKIDGKGPTPEQVQQGNKRRQEALKADPVRHALANEAQRKSKERRLENESPEDEAERKKSEADRAAYDRNLRTDEQTASVKKKNAEWMRQDRIANPAKYAAIDKAKYDKKKADPVAHEKEKKRQREKEQKQRDEKKEAGGFPVTAPTTTTTASGHNVCTSCKMATAWSFDECWSCRIGKKLKNKFEAEVLTVLGAEGLLWTAYNRQGACSPGDAMRISDITFEAEMPYTVILEVDEDCHRGYTPECETVRVQQVRETYPDKPVFFIRYHPIRLQVTRGTVTTRGLITTKSKEQLIACLKAVFALPPPGENELPCGYNMVFLGYPEGRVEELASKRESMQHEAMHTLLAAKKKNERLLAHAQVQARASASSSSK
jgi:hypothetical protein